MPAHLHVHWLQAFTGMSVMINTACAAVPR